jgi:ABC-type antimicrobial peptide transport system permease subunit
VRLSGRLRSSLIIGGQGIRARKLRTLLSMVSLFLGVLAVVAVQAGSVIAERALLADIEMTTGKDGTLQVYLPSAPESATVAMDTVRGHGDAVAITSTQAVIGEPGVRPVNEGGGPLEESAGSYSTGLTRYCDDSGACRTVEDDQDAPQMPQGKAIELNLQGLSADIRQFRPFRTQSGEWLDFGGAPSLSPRIVLNTKAAEAFRKVRVPAEMRVAGALANPTPRIVGVVDDGGYMPTAYVRSDELLNWMPVGAIADPNFGGVQLLMSPAATDLEQILRSRLDAAGANIDEFQVVPVDSREHLASELSLLRWIFLGMAALVLLIGVAGILNVGLATVGERVEEFALRRAVGTPRLLLAGIVLAETLLTGLLTAMLAIGVGIVGLKGTSWLFAAREPFLADVQFPWQAGVAGVVAGLVAGVLGGLIPAVRAARIPIATVMRA